MPTPACRLYFILAREAPVAVIFRRGPSKWVQLIKWNTDTDTFEPGQWFHGRIYERRSDLSPDGTKLVYFAQKISPESLKDAEAFYVELQGKRVPRLTDYYTYAWTAVSKPPFLTALALWPKGDCWHGGGLFESNKRLRLNHRPGFDRPHRKHQPQALKVVSNPDACGEDAPILYERLKRDGWRHRREWQGRYEQGSFMQRLKELMRQGDLPPEEFARRMLDWDLDDLTLDAGYVTEAPGIWEKADPSGEQVLVMQESINGFTTRDDFFVGRPGGDGAEPVHGAVWADWDHRGRLVYANAGKLFARAPREGDEELADFNRDTPEALEAPAWAKRW